MILLRKKLALLVEKIGVDRRGEVNLLKGIVNEGELVADIRGSTDSEEDWSEVEERTVDLETRIGQNWEEQTHFEAEGS